MSIVGCEKSTYFLAGSYFFAALVNSKPVFKSRKIVPSGFGELSGKDLYLYYNELSLAWVVSTAFGGTDVLAFCVDESHNVLSLRSPWYVKSGNGFALNNKMSVDSGLQFCR